MTDDIPEKPGVRNSSPLTVCSYQNEQDYQDTAGCTAWQILPQKVIKFEKLASVIQFKLDLEKTKKNKSNFTVT